MLEDLVRRERLYADLRRGRNPKPENGGHPTSSEQAFGAPARGQFRGAGRAKTRVPQLCSAGDAVLWAIESLRGKMAGASAADRAWQVQLQTVTDLRAKYFSARRYIQASRASNWRRGVHYRMKKLLLLFCLLPMLASFSYAQESRQDASASFTGNYQPTITGNTVTQTSTFGKGVLLSYRFMLTPSSAIEGNYQYSQMNMDYVVGGSSNSTGYSSAKFHNSLQEGSVAYVRSFVYKNFNPFAEAGVGMLLFDPIDDSGTTTNAGTRTRKVGALLGVGIAYELSPSWDIRAEYRGFVLKSVDFGIAQFNANRYYWMQEPTIGFAYHF